MPRHREKRDERKEKKRKKKKKKKKIIINCLIKNITSKKQVYLKLPI